MRPENHASRSCVGPNGEVVTVVGGGYGRHGFFPHAVFERQDAVLAPLGKDHAVYAGALGWGAGMKAREEVLEGWVEVGGGFIFEEDGVGVAAAAAVSKGVAGGAALSCFGLGAGG
jgi:hypothetical protein